MAFTLMHHMAIVTMLNVIVRSHLLLDAAYMASTARIAYRRNRVRRQQRALYGAVLAGLIHDEYALEAELQALDAPLRSVYVRPRWATKCLPPSCNHPTLHRSAHLLI